MKIERLQIETNHLDAQKRFYEETLNLPVSTDSSKERVAVQIGYSVLEFVQSAQAKPYHVAFHIAAHKEKQALAWLKQRVDILPLGDSEIIDFSSWNAKSIYFYDADHNIIEFIARRHRHHRDTPAFSKNDIIGIAEIGLVVHHVKSTFEKLNTQTGLKQYSGDLEKFCPIGDDSGLLITIDNRKKKTWFPTDDKAKAATFRLVFSHEARKNELQYDGRDLHIV